MNGRGASRPPHPWWPLRGARRLFIVPDGQLHLLPFDAVIAASDQTAGGLSVTIAPSASVLALLRTKSEVTFAKVDRPLLAIGGVPYERMTGAGSTGAAPVGTVITGFFDAAMPAKLPTLPRSEAEVRMAADILGPRSVVLVGDAATETRFDCAHWHASNSRGLFERQIEVVMKDQSFTLIRSKSA